MSALVEVEDLKKYFPVKTRLFRREKKVVHAVDGVSFHIRDRENLGLVGESGCGKTTIAKLVLRLIEPTSGTVRYNGQNIFRLNAPQMRKLRREMQIVFQDPFASLNPRKTVRQILSKPYLTHKIVEKVEVDRKVLELLEIGGFSPPDSYIDRYPHEFSGGQRQRIGILRAIAVHPRFVVADEPVSALDLSIRAQILNLMRELQKKFALSYLFITHDLAVVRSICDRVAVMYLGKIVELAEVNELFQNPLHPYTKAIISATPIPDPEACRSRTKLLSKGDVPSPIDLPSGCRFHTRCPLAKSKCSNLEPELFKATNDHFVACHAT